MNRETTIKPVRALAVAATLVLSACAAPPPETGADPQTPQAKMSATHAARTPAPSLPKIEAPSLAELQRMDRREIASLFGAATLVRTDLSAEIWQYRSSACVLFVFLYPQDETGSVRHVESTGEGDARACATAVLRERKSAAG